MAARDLDWGGRLPERHRGIIRIEAILVRPETQFFSRLAHAFRRIAATLDSLIQIQVTFLDENDPAGIAARINDRAQRRAGRTAGLMLSKLGAEDGSVLVLRHSLDHQGHGDRVRVETGPSVEGCCALSLAACCIVIRASRFWVSFSRACG